MKRIALLLVSCLLLIALLFRLPGALFDVKWALTDSIAVRGYIWEPLRKARIRLYVSLGASPNDIVMGESTYSLAVSMEDLFFLEAYASAVSPEIFLDALALACEAPGKPERVAMMTKLYRANMHSTPPECGEEILLTPAPWRGRKRPSEQSLKHETERDLTLTCGWSENMKLVEMSKISTETIFYVQTNFSNSEKESSDRRRLRFPNGRYFGFASSQMAVIVEHPHSLVEIC